MIACPVCRTQVADFPHLADHFWEAAEASDVGHVMWLNRHVGMRELPRDALRERLEKALRRQRGVSPDPGTPSTGIRSP